MFSTKIPGIFISITALIIVLCSYRKCDLLEPGDSLELVYFNSFESPSDTLGWKGYADIEFYKDAPSCGGEQSLFVSGGCIVPHAYVEFVNESASGDLKLSCWGKVITGSGVVELKLKRNPRKYIGISIKDTVWTYYKPENSFRVEPGDSLILEVISGGFIPAAILVDLIKVTLTED